MIVLLVVVVNEEGVLQIGLAPLVWRLLEVDLVLSQMGR